MDDLDCDRQKYLGRTTLDSLEFTALVFHKASIRQCLVGHAVFVQRLNFSRSHSSMDFFIEFKAGQLSVVQDRSNEDCLWKFNTEANVLLTLTKTVPFIYYVSVNFSLLKQFYSGFTDIFADSYVSIDTFTNGHVIL